MWFVSPPVSNAITSSLSGRIVPVGEPYCKTRSKPPRSLRWPHRMRRRARALRTCPHDRQHSRLRRARVGVVLRAIEQRHGLGLSVLARAARFLLPVGAHHSPPNESAALVAQGVDDLARVLRRLARVLLGLLVGTANALERDVGAARTATAPTRSPEPPAAAAVMPERSGGVNLAESVS